MPDDDYTAAFDPQQGDVWEHRKYRGTITVDRVERGKVHARGAMSPWTLKEFLKDWRFIRPAAESEAATNA